MGHADVHICFAQRLAIGPAAMAVKADDRHVALMGCLYGLQHTGVVATREIASSTSPEPPQRAHLAGKLLKVAIGHRRSAARCRCTAPRRQLRALPLEACRHKRRKLLGIGAAETPLPQASTLPPLVTQASSAWTASAMGLLKVLGGLVFQVRAVDEVLLDALLKHA
jgi:hypothetical protein